MKKCRFLLVVLLLCLSPIAAGEALPAATSDTVDAAIYDTGYTIALSTDWVTTTGTDDHRVLIEATSPDGACRLRVFGSEQTGWHLDDWKQALQKASTHNSVSDIGELTMGKRRFIVYDTLLSDPTLPYGFFWSAATECADGVFITLEFGTKGSAVLEDSFGAARDAILLSLHAVE